MKMDHPPVSKDIAVAQHLHNVHHVEKHYGGDGHKHHHHEYGKHAAGHKKEHEKVIALCGGGKSK
jgi:hypothetical protein